MGFSSLGVPKESFVTAAPTDSVSAHRLRLALLAFSTKGSDGVAAAATKVGVILVFFAGLSSMTAACPGGQGGILIVVVTGGSFGTSTSIIGSLGTSYTFPNSCCEKLIIET